MGRSSITRAALVCALAIAALAFGANAASASMGLRLASGTALTVTARGRIRFAMGVDTICTVDLLIRINESMVKSVGASVGSVQLAGSTFSGCNLMGTVILNADSSLTYARFGGTLPAGITSVGAVANAFTFRIINSVWNCQYIGNLGLEFTGPGTSYTGLNLSGSARTSTPPCLPSIPVISTSLALYANAALGTTLTSVAINLF